MASPAVAASSWSKLTDSGPVFLFLALSGGLWLLALAAWELGGYSSAVVLTGLGAAAPLFLMVAHVQLRPSIWVLRVPVEATAVEAAVRRAIANRKMTGQAVSALQEKGAFRRCEAVLRIKDPDCLVGWRRSAGPSSTQGPSGRSTLYLMGGRKEVTALGALRDSISSELLGLAVRASA